MLTRESQWPQVADFVAHTAFQAIARTPNRAFLWEWYAQRLGAMIVRDEQGWHGIHGLQQHEGPLQSDPS